MAYARMFDAEQARIVVMRVKGASCEIAAATRRSLCAVHRCAASGQRA